MYFPHKQITNSSQQSMHLKCKPHRIKSRTLQLRTKVPGGFQSLPERFTTFPVDLYFGGTCSVHPPLHHERRRINYASPARKIIVFALAVAFIVSTFMNFVTGRFLQGARSESISAVRI